MRAKVGFEEWKVESIIVTEIPYQVNKARYDQAAGFG
jgi:DNA gyrase/topoisomerase IV subunit A